MGLKHQAIFFCIIVGFCIFFNSMLVLSATDEEVEDEREFNYVNGGKVGPQQWGEIHEDWAICSKGKMQSPIDLESNRVTVVPQLGLLRRSYRPAPAILQNRGHDIMLKWEDDAGSIWINGTKYSLKQLHWHSPSEHTINGRRYALEMHMVHESADKKLAVVGILYTSGRPDQFLAKMEGLIDKLRDRKEEKEEVGTVDPREIKRGSRKYYRYLGSLTTPPCTEGVVWSIVNKVRTVSKEQVQLLREAVHDDFDENARPIQATHDRSVSYYRPKFVKQ